MNGSDVYSPYSNESDLCELVNAAGVLITLGGPDGQDEGFKSTVVGYLTAAGYDVTAMVVGAESGYSAGETIPDWSDVQKVQ